MVLTPPNKRSPILSTMNAAYMPHALGVPRRAASMVAGSLAGPWWSGAAWALLAICCYADSSAATDKSQFTLFKPTPRELMRELSTDRPDQTESPHTVDAGHLQLEMDFFNHVRDRDRSRGRNVRTTELSVAPLNLKVGLLNHVDLQLMFDPYVRLRTEDRATGISERVSGVGDITTRLKINLWGNDSGPSAFALLPFVKLPLSASKVRNGETEGGMFAIVGQALPAGWGAAAMTGVEFVSDGAGGHDNEYINSLALSRALTAHWGAYIEFFSVTGSAPGFRWQGQLDLGFTYALTEDTQFDFGCNFGVTKAAADYQPFVGVSQRF